MGLVRRLFIISTPFIGCYAVSQNLARRYPNVPMNELPKEMKIHSYTNRTSDVYYPEIDCYKKTVVVPEDKPVSTSEIVRQFLEVKPLRAILKKDSLSKSPFESRVVETYESDQTSSAVIQWSWRPNLGIVLFFEKIALKWHYPYRLMNGGYHEVFVTENKLLLPSKSRSKSYEVYFICAHQYNDKHDNKIIPRWTSSLHRTYARIILVAGTKPYRCSRA